MAPQAEELATLQERLRADSAEHQRLQGGIAEAERSGQEIRIRTEGLAGLRREFAEAQSDEAADRARSGELGQRRELLLHTIGAAATLGSDLRELSGSLERARSSVEISVGRLHRADGDAEAARRRISEAQTRVRERHRLRAAAKDLQGTAEFLTGPFRDAMLELEHRLLARAKVEFDRSFGRYFAALIEDPSLVARSDPRFDPSVEIDGEVTPPEALSGGERTALALAFRLALGDVVRSLDRLNLSTLILDEPTDGFSPEQVQRMGELLSELGLPQVDPGLPRGRAERDRGPGHPRPEGRRTLGDLRRGFRSSARQDQRLRGVIGTRPLPTVVARRPSGSRRGVPGIFDR